MTVTTKPHETNVDSPAVGTLIADGAIGTHNDGQVLRPTSEQVWRALAKASFAVVSYVTPSGAPRSSGVVYTVVDCRLYIVVAPGSWKARHIALTGQVAVTVPVRRGGVLSLLLPIPPATVSFHATAVVHPGGSPRTYAVAQALEKLKNMLPDDRRDSSTVIEIIPEDRFLTFGIGIPLMQMRDPAVALAQVPVS